MQRGLLLSFAIGVGLVACGSSDEEGLFSGAGGTAGSGVGGSATGGSAGSSTSGGASGSGGSGGSSAAGGVGGASGAGAGGDAGSGVGGSAGEAGAGVGGSATGGAGGAGGSGGSGAVPGIGSCWGHCGSNQPVDAGGGQNCYCDSVCSGQNDCCSDYKAACGPAGAGAVSCLTAGTCSTASSFCCMSFTGSGYEPSCAPKGQSCDPGADVNCDGPEDCTGGTVCCGSYQSTSGGGFWTAFGCRSPSQCGNWPNPIICGNDPSVCNGDPCRVSGSIPQIRYCDPQ